MTLVFNLPGGYAYTDGTVYKADEEVDDRVEIMRDGKIIGCCSLKTTLNIHGDAHLKNVKFIQTKQAAYDENLTLHIFRVEVLDDPDYAYEYGQAVEERMRREAEDALMPGYEW